MKNLMLLTLVLLTSAIAVTAQVNPSISAVNPKAPPANRSDAPPVTRARVLGQAVKKQTPAATDNQTLQAHAKGSFKNRARLESLGAQSENDKGARASEQPAVLNTTAKPVIQDAKTVKAPIANTSMSSFAAVSAASSQVYRVGVGDVLDINVNNSAGPASTLYTVIGGGMLEYPLVGTILPVAGLTTTEIAALLKQKLKLFENPEVSVKVRDYASHNVTVTGLVASPGNKALRREAVPLYAVLAEAMVLPTASAVTITRAQASISLDLKDASTSATMIVSGDVIKVTGSASSADFFIVTGAVKLPGQKAFQSGMTLTAAIFAAGGATDAASDRVKISRQSPDGRVITEEFDLKKIQEGKAIDPLLQRDDRIELTSTN